MSNREIALQLTLKALEDNKLKVIPGETCDQFNEAVGKQISIIFNSILKGITND